ncbi:BID domain-containing T4SS effector [Bartonella harrusi]|uniref:protein adenylyltransferase n=1 Tax=Bartonella harrusi TaxID=2961895 RepID=A0ABY5ES28_9HYPH|nr:BID domain-containing T4SS effector [Bartonella harrusi]UTO28072.1 BID domain-containing T4SS effector [Bartonella harrusi]
MPKAKSKMKGIPSPHHYIYPGTHVLKNKYGETNLKVFLEKCSEDREQATKLLRKEALPEHFDFSYLCHIHHQLFKNTFEWAGKIRTVPFTFADGTTASMPEMKRAEWNKAFVKDEEILENLQKLEKIIAEKNNLQGLTRQDFISQAVGIFLSLKNIHPFVDGNEHTEQLFFENLAKAAGHQLDFSLVTQERMMAAYTQAAQYGNPEPMWHLFEDISNPPKIRMLQSFMKNMKELGRDVDDHPVMTAKEGITYLGIYKDINFDSFMLDAQGTYIIGNKEQLTPEQIKTLKSGDTILFTAPKAQELENTFIPRETLAPLTESEFAQRVANSAYIQAARDQIQHLSKIVYGSSKTLNEQMEDIFRNPDLGRKIAQQIKRTPHSIAPLSGVDFFFFKTPTRARAEEHINPLCAAVMDYAEAITYKRHVITQEHHIEQARCGKAIEKPSKNLQNLFCLSPEKQTEILSQSPHLYQELRIFVHNLDHRFSLEEYNAIKNHDYVTLAKTIGVSEQKAKEITNTVEKAKAVHERVSLRKLNRSNVLAIAN